MRRASQPGKVSHALALPMAADRLPTRGQAGARVLTWLASTVFMPTARAIHRNLA